MSDIQTFPSAELEVPGEPGVYWCAKHRKVKTRLRCGRCEKPICPQCTMMGPTGARCRDCGSNRTSHMYKVGALNFVISFVASMVLGALGAFIVSTVGIYILFFASAAGPFLGKVVTTITRGKRGTPLAIAVSVGLIVGALLSAAAPVLPLLLLAHGAPHAGAAMTPLLLESLGNPYLWIFLAISIPGVWWWLR